MVYKKFEKRKGKIFGPYYYESYREGEKVKKRYIGDEKDYQRWLKIKNKNVEQRFSRKFVVGFLSVFLFLSFGFILFNSDLVTQELYHVQRGISGYGVSGGLVGLTSEELVYGSYEDEGILESYEGNDVDLEIKEPVKLGRDTISKNRNSRMEFDAGGDNIRLYFDLLNYSEFVGEVSSVIVEDVAASIDEISEDAVSETVEEEISEEEVSEDVVSNVTEIVNETSEEVGNETIVVNKTFPEEDFGEEEISEQLDNETESFDELNESEESLEKEIVEEINETEDEEISEGVSEDVVSEEVVEEVGEAEAGSEEVSETDEETILDSEISDSGGSEEVIDEPEVEEEAEMEEEEVEEGGVRITANVVRGFTGFFLKAVGYDVADIGFNVSEEENASEKLNESVIQEIKKGIDFDDVQSVADDLTRGELEEIEDEAIVEAEDFEIVVNDSKIEAEKPEYKWGYRVKLHDLNFMAKIDVTANQTISVWNSDTLRIGDNLLSFSDLVDAGYSVRIEVPSLEMETEIDVNESIEDEAVIETENETIEEFDNESLIVESETIINETVEGDENEGVEQLINESETSEEENETSEEMSNESEEEVEIDANEPIIEEEIVEETVEVEEEIVEEVVEEEVELTITANVIRGFLGLVVDAIGGEEVDYGNVSFGSEVVVEDVEYEYAVTIYIERDFTNNSENISVGDIIFLDPILTKISVLNVYSYPSLYGNWTVMLNTTGTANLTITATRDVNYSEEWTRWSNYSEDSGLYDLKFLEIRCGNETLDYKWLGENCSRQECSVFIPDYSCNKTGSEISNVLTSHQLKNY